MANQIMNTGFIGFLQQQLKEIEQAGFTKEERVLQGSQQVEITVNDGSRVLNFCANNYLGLANDPRLVQAAKDGMQTYGFGCASVRFICGTQDIHKRLEKEVSNFLQTDDTILFSSCFDANGGVFEALLGEEDAILSDSLNHASLIDGIRLCKAKRFRYENNNMQDLEQQLQTADMQNARFKLIVTDGVFSMDGIIANLPSITQLAKTYNALVMVDDSHATGFMGQSGAGIPQYFSLSDKVDIYTGTFGKALGGASGGYVSGRQEIIDILRQRSRPYLFSNSLAPAVVAATLEVFSLLKSEGQALQERLFANARYFREQMSKAGFRLIEGEHAIIPVMLGDAALAVKMASRLLQEGVYVIAFSYPVVPQGKARIRTQMSASHTKEQIDKAVAAFIKVGKELEVIS